MQGEERRRQFLAEQEMADNEVISVIALHDHSLHCVASTELAN